MLRDCLEKPQRPCLFVLGGVKTAGTLQIMRAALDKGIADRVLVGGLVGQTLLWAGGYEIGEASKQVLREQGDEPLLKAAEELLDHYTNRIVLPTDYGYGRGGERREAMLHALAPDELVLDIGLGTADVFRRMICEAKTVFVNGTMGVYERPESDLGTRTVWEALAQTGAYTVLCGTDSVLAAKKFGMEQAVDYICTGDESLLQVLQGL